MAEVRVQQLTETYLHQNPQQQLREICCDSSFWQNLSTGALPELEQGALMSAFYFDKDWPAWERHPAGSELVLLLSGATELYLQQPDELTQPPQRLVLCNSGDYVLIPAGVWHRACPQSPTTLLFLTPGLGTEHKPV
jgi:hypothetical protein